ncbi:MAG: BolA/IbaG family iron-sulfur metabolism protein [Gammaproteobacteria bacterium]|nr:BolA/IbaG family iron-sulfur metabolism protein [Gammaproteobacteria bacterium]MYE83162.1 BolA/IbaG family iron-sulfur metabolism protein [Gammaproteobacteria bacterium]
MNVQETIEAKLAEALAPAHLVVENESSNHNVPAGSESHFRVVVVADGFEGRRLLERHRMVNAALQDELAGPVHALALHTYTPADWKARFGEAPMSPPCLGGQARETRTGNT